MIVSMLLWLNFDQLNNSNPVCPAGDQARWTGTFMVKLEIIFGDKLGMM
jgi:hypothetical protein